MLSRFARAPVQRASPKNKHCLFRLADETFDRICHVTSPVEDSSR